ncbi:MAG: 4Fe-4S dicluster domain-containing protein [Candidatus Kariarchaeaceae archaeon]|jgi:quinone-modifying oxidoreductase subunit QmoC
MVLKVKPSLFKELMMYGLKTTEICLNCPQCTAKCNGDGTGMPNIRKAIRLLQLGLKDVLLKNAEIWMCENCDECSATCPNGKELGSIMMALRRWYVTKSIDERN